LFLLEGFLYKGLVIALAPDAQDQGFYAMESSPTFHTPRLLLTPLQLTDAPAIQRLFAHWEVVRYLDSRVPWPYPEEGALSYVRDIALPAIAAGREWHWMIRLHAEPAQSIGSISLYDQPGNNRGFWLAPQWQGKGYMREACEVITAYWFETLLRPVMQVPKAVDNHASRRVSEHEGMQMIGVQQGHFVSGPMLKEIWQMNCAEWLDRRSSTPGISSAAPDAPNPARQRSQD
jgi:RimJ/RimL family protein N-acetyltransferase